MAKIAPPTQEAMDALSQRRGGGRYTIQPPTDEAMAKLRERERPTEPEPPIERAERRVKALHRYSPADVERMLSEFERTGRVVEPTPAFMKPQLGTPDPTLVERAGRGAAGATPIYGKDLLELMGTDVKPPELGGKIAQFVGAVPMIVGSAGASTRLAVSGLLKAGLGRAASRLGGTSLGWAAYVSSVDPESRTNIKKIAWNLGEGLVFGGLSFIKGALVYPAMAATGHTLSKVEHGRPIFSLPDEDSALMTIAFPAIHKVLRFDSVRQVARDLRKAYPDLSHKKSVQMAKTLIDNPEAIKRATELYKEVKKGAEEAAKQEKPPEEFTKAVGAKVDKLSVIPETAEPPGMQGGHFHGTNSAGLSGIMSEGFRSKGAGVAGNLTKNFRSAARYALDKRLTEDKKAYVVETDTDGNVAAVHQVTDKPGAPGEIKVVDSSKVEMGAEPVEAVREPPTERVPEGRGETLRPEEFRTDRRAEDTGPPEGIPERRVAKWDAVRLDADDMTLSPELKAEFEKMKGPKKSKEPEYTEEYYKYRKRAMEMNNEIADLRKKAKAATDPEIKSSLTDKANTLRGRRETVLENMRAEDWKRRREPTGMSLEEARRPFKENREKVIKARKLTWKRMWEGLRVAGWDTSGNIQTVLSKLGKYGKEASMRLDLTRGAIPWADKVIQEDFGVVYKGITPAEELLLNEYITSVRNLTIAAYKPEVDRPISPRESRAFLRTLKSSSPELYRRIKDAGDEFFSVMRRELDLLYKHGLLTKDKWMRLRDTGPYSPTEFIEAVDGRPVVGREKVSVPTSGLKRLGEGDIGPMEENSREFIAQVVRRTRKRISNNEAAKALLKVANTTTLDPSERDDLVKMAPSMSAKTPLDKTDVYAMVAGKARRMWLNSRYEKEWSGQVGELPHNIGLLLGWATGTIPLKLFATGINPAFAITNLPRDLGLIFLSTGEYSTSVPIYMAQVGADLKATFRDAFTRSGAYEDAVREGLSMNFLTQQGRIDRPIGKIGGRWGGARAKGNAEVIGDVLGYIGNSTEIWARLALRRRAMLNGKSSVEATHVARNYLDFAKGGVFTKVFDTAIPYLNASVQGTRSVLRAAARDPGKFTAKVLQLGGLAMALRFYNNIYNRESIEEEAPENKSNNWLITLPISFEDEQGEIRHVSLKISKDQMTRPIATVFEALVDSAMGFEVDVEEVTAAAKNMLTISGEQAVPPLLKAMIGRMDNYDLWRQEKIWKGPDVGPIPPGKYPDIPEGVKGRAQEHDAYTHPWLVWFGEKTGMSPERSAYALSQIFTNSNMFVQALGTGTKELYNKLNPEDRKEVQRTLWEEIRRIPGASRVLSISGPYLKEKERIVRRGREAATVDLVRMREARKLADKYREDPSMENFNKIVDNLTRLKWYDARRILNRIVDDIETADVQQGWWFRLVHHRAGGPEEKAELFFDRWMRMSPEMKDDFAEAANDYPHFVTDRFRIRMEELISEYTKNQQAQP
jgi:hypothetical protein